jgi:hypothetical protein
METLTLVRVWFVNPHTNQEEAGYWHEPYRGDMDEYIEKEKAAYEKPNRPAGAIKTLRYEKAQFQRLSD